MNQTSKKEHKFLKDLLVAFFGVTAALFVNSLYESCNKIDSYKSMAKAIKAEARGNSKILQQSFIDNVTDTSLKSKDSIIIYREFKISVAEECLQNDNFMAHVSDSTIQNLTNYILSLRRMNAYRESYQKYLEDELVNPFQIYHLRKSIYNEIPVCKGEITKIESVEF